MTDLIIITAVQIILESLPISSTGHLLIAQRLWTVVTGRALTPVPEFFDHFLHGPTVLVIAVVFFKDWWASGRRLVCSCVRVVQGRRLSWTERRLWQLVGFVAACVCVADAVTALAYVMQRGVGKLVVPAQAGIQPYSDPYGMYAPWVLVVDFTVSMLGLLSLRFVPFDTIFSLSLKNHSGQAEAHPVDSAFDASINRPFVPSVLRSKTYRGMRTALLLGAVQGAALLLPGLSRFGSTYVAGRWLRLSARRAFQFSFLMQLPLIAAAFFLKGVPDVIKSPADRALLTMPLLATMVVSTVVAALLFAWVYRLAVPCRVVALNQVQGRLSREDGRERLWLFGVYMLVPLTVLVFLVFK